MNDVARLLGEVIGEEREHERDLRAFMLGLSAAERDWTLDIYAPTDRAEEVPVGTVRIAWLATSAAAMP